MSSILVPLDGSERSAGIVIPASRIAVHSKAQLVLLQVVESSEPSEREEAEYHLTRQRDELRAAGLTAQCRLELGDPTAGILAAIEELSPRLVAMSTHGRTGLSRVVRGSVAERVLRGSKAPLLVATPEALDQPRPFATILVPLDGSHLAEQILRPVEVLANVFGSEVVLLWVRPDRGAETAEAVLEGQRQRLAQAGLSVGVRTFTGDAAEGILTHAADADLVAMASHGRSGLSRLWFGSVTEQVVRSCPRPLLVTRPG